jgi:GT2 family glycosyltransferase
VTTADAPRAGGPAAGAPDVSVVIVSYNTKALLDACLRSVFASTGVAFDVWVVDNSSPDGSADHVETAFPAAHLIRNPVNRGFAAANNVALPHTRGRHVLLLNPDTVVREDTIAELATFLDARPRVGIAGPRVLNGDGTVQSCGYWYPTLRAEILQSRNVNRLLRVLFGTPPVDPDPHKETQVDWVDGCCLMIRREVIDDIGGLDEQFFLYAEELDWCRTAKRAGWQLATCPRSEMTHLRGQSSSQVKAPALAMLVEARLRYYRKQDGVFTAAAVSVVYVLGCLRRWSSEPAKSGAKVRGVVQWWRALVGLDDRQRTRLVMSVPTAGLSRRAG